MKDELLKRIFSDPDLNQKSLMTANRLAKAAHKQSEQAIAEMNKRLIFDWRKAVGGKCPVCGCDHEKCKETL